MLPRHHWARRSEQLDPVRDTREISLHVSAHDFPWDNLQALSFALFRTYAVPSIGRLLDRTGEFTERVQKRYDDTGLLLEEVQRHGLRAVGRGRSAVRRINQMHGMYDISNEDLRYVLSTFVVMPKRWMDDFGFRTMTPNEVAATTNYYIDLGRHMNIKDLPQDFAGFEKLLDDYEREHFAFDEGARRVADATLDLMTTFPPNNLAPRWLVRRFAWSLMDEPLLRAFHYPVPTRFGARIFRGAMRAARAAAPALPGPFAAEVGRAPTAPSGLYPAGYEIDDLGTFHAGPGTRCSGLLTPVAVTDGTTRDFLAVCRPVPRQRADRRHLRRLAAGPAVAARPQPGPDRGSAGRGGPVRGAVDEREWSASPTVSAPGCPVSSAAA